VRLKDYSIASIVEEMVIIQTCNRVEIYAVIDDKKGDSVCQELIHVWKGQVEKHVSRITEKRFEDYLEVNYDIDAVRHLFRLTAGLESMIIGEDQILGQIKDSLVEARLSKKIGPILSLIFDRAVKLGAKIRTQVRINGGAVSVGSVAINLAEKSIGNLQSKSSLIIGAGEVGLLVAKALVVKGQRSIFATSRSADRVMTLAKIVGVKALMFQEALEKLQDVDLVVLATSSPYPILTKETLEQIIKKRYGKILLILDLSNPRNAEESISGLPDVKLLTIDDLRSELNHNLSLRMDGVKHVEEFVGKELDNVYAIIQGENTEPVITSLYKRAEIVRIRELSRALRVLGDIDFETLRVINDLSIAIVEGILNEPVSNLRRIAEKPDIEYVGLNKKLKVE